MSAVANVKLRVRRHFSASSARVFDAWLDPANAGRWLFATPKGQLLRVQIDARVGGAFAIVERRGAEEVVHAGEYRHIERPRRLAFTFGVAGYSAAMTQVNIEIAPQRGGCELVLTHENVLAQVAIGSAAGWARMLDGLAASIA